MNRTAEATLCDESFRAGAELVQEIVRAFKVRRLYDRTHPQRRGSEEATAGRIAALLEASGPIEITVETGRLLVGGEAVYDQPEGRDSIAFLLYREGLRRLSFYPGLTAEELGAFLEGLAAASLTGTEDELDLLARLWERSFVHIRYAFVEKLLDQDWAPGGEAGEGFGDWGDIAVDGPGAVSGPGGYGGLGDGDGGDDPRARGRGMLVLGRDEDMPVAIDGERSAADFLRDAQPTLYYLDDEDMATLQRELEAEKDRTLFTETLTCLRELLMNPEAGDPVPVLEAIAEIHASLLAEGSYADLAELHALFQPYLESGRADEAGRSAFAELRARALDPTELMALAGRLESGAVDERKAARFYRAFGRGALSHLLGSCGDLKRLCQDTEVAEAFKALAREDGAGLRMAILDGDPAVACPAAYLAGLVADPLMLDPLIAALDAADHQIRREALAAVKQIGGGRALEAIAGRIDDPDPTVRLYALRHIVLHRYIPALPEVKRLLRDGAVRSPTERRLLYEAYGALGGGDVVAELGRLLRPRGILRRVDPEETACVLVGLGAAGTPAARVLVEQASGRRQLAIQRAAVEVLDSWDAPAAIRR